MSMPEVKKSGFLGLGNYWEFNSEHIQLLREFYINHEWDGLSLSGPPHPHYVIMAGNFPDPVEEAGWWQGNWFPTIEHHYLSANTDDTKMKLQVGITGKVKEGVWRIHGTNSWATVETIGDAADGDNLANLINGQIEMNNPLVEEVHRREIDRGLDIRKLDNPEM